MAVTQCEHISVRQEENVLRIAFNRADKKNAITRDMYTAMAAAIEESNADSSIRVLTIEGTDGCFTSGNDLKDFMNAPNTGEGSPVGRFLAALSTAQKPVVAGVTGIAVGIGTTMLLHCDFAYASENATFHMPFVNLGLVPEFGSSLLLPELVGMRRASEMLMLGEPFDVKTAEACGIINGVVPLGAAIEAALSTAKRLAAQPPSAIRLTKQLMRGGSAKAIEDRIRLEGDHFATRLTSPEALEAFQAFMEKRKADFSKFS